LTGRVLAGRFHVAERLHLGGTVEVYAATDLRGGEDVAVKVLARFIAQDTALRARLATEAQAAGVLQHPNVVRIIDYGEEEDGVAFIVMERLHGRTLRQHLDEVGRLDIGDACAVARDVLASLSAAHRLGIRHRDLKPANVFFSTTQDGKRSVKLMDFGVAKIEGGVKRSLAGAVGTPRYFPPERIKDPASEDHRGDLYAAGVILYEAITGKHPFAGGTLEQQMVNMMASSAPPVREARAEVPEAVERVIARALEREPALRWSNAEEMSSALEAAMA
jgi:serine/threonine-protein kinase